METIAMTIGFGISYLVGILIGKMIEKTENLFNEDERIELDKTWRDHLAEDGDPAHTEETSLWAYGDGGSDTLN